jgi:hypothetical protein
MLDGWPALHLTVPDLAWIAKALGISAAELVAAVETLMPATHNNDEGEAPRGTGTGGPRRGALAVVGLNTNRLRTFDSGSSPRAAAGSHQAGGVSR